MNSISGTPTLLLFDLHSQSPRTGLSCGNLPGDKSSHYQWTQTSALPTLTEWHYFFKTILTAQRLNSKAPGCTFVAKLSHAVTKISNKNQECPEFKVTLFWLLCTPFYSFCWASTDTRALPTCLHVLVTGSRTPCQLTFLSMCNTSSRSGKIQHAPTLQFTWLGGLTRNWS